MLLYLRFSSVRVSATNLARMYDADTPDHEDQLSID